MRPRAYFQRSRRNRKEAPGNRLGARWGLKGVWKIGCGFSDLPKLLEFLRFAENKLAMNWLRGAVVLQTIERLAAVEQRTFHFFDILASLAVEQTVAVEIDLNECRTSVNGPMDERLG